MVAGLVTILALALAGTDRLTPAGVLLFCAISTGGTLSALRALAQRTTRLEPAQLGLRPVPPRLAAVAIGAGALAIALLAILAQATGHPFAQPSIPPELSSQDSVSRALGDPDPTIVTVGFATAVSVFARAVVAVVVVEILLRGFVLPILARRLGAPGAIAIVAVCFGSLAPALGGRGDLVVEAMALGALLCWLYAETGSILPGIAVAAAATGGLLAAGFGWGLAAVLVQALACGTCAVGLVVPLALGGPTRIWDLRPGTS
jgi:membrane protease YdiL (CAAX protease family)